MGGVPLVTVIEKCTIVGYEYERSKRHARSTASCGEGGMKHRRRPKIWLRVMDESGATREADLYHWLADRCSNFNKSYAVKWCESMLGQKIKFCIDSSGVGAVLGVYRKVEKNQKPE